MAEFKAGAFKMAHKAGAPVFPISITSADKVMPIGWMMCMKPAFGVSDVIVHPPIESKDKTEDELVEAVRQSMIDGLPEHQKPLWSTIRNTENGCWQKTSFSRLRLCDG